MALPSTIWSGYVRSAPFFMVALAALSFIVLGLSVKHGVMLSNEKLDAYYLRHWGPPSGVYVPKKKK